MSIVPGLAKVLLTNPNVRRVLVKNAKRAVSSASTAMASKGEQRSGGPFSKGPLNRVNPIDSVAKSLVTSVAKPMAQKLASTEAGRSLLETIHNISGDALGKTPKRPERALDAVIRLAGAAASAAGSASLARAKTSTARSGPSSSRPHGSSVQSPQHVTSAKRGAGAEDGNS
jgi:hypothetical protein